MFRTSLKFSKFNYINKMLTFCLIVLLILFSIPSFSDPKPACAKTAASTAADQLVIKVGDSSGVYTQVKTFQLSDLESLAQVKQAYSYIDSIPYPVIDSATGVKLTDILSACNVDVNKAINFKFWTTDVSGAPYQTLTKSYLLDTPRFYFPHLADNWKADNGTISFPDPTAAAEGAVSVSTIIAFQDNWQRESSGSLQPDFSVQDSSIRYRLVFGKTNDLANANPEITAPKSARWITEIDVTLSGSAPSDGGSTGGGTGGGSGAVQLKTAPTLTSTPTNTASQTVDLSFVDNSAWRSAISGITLDGKALSKGQYTVTAGKIQIAADTITTVGSHAIVVKATGYNDASVTQVQLAPPRL